MRGFSLFHSVIPFVFYGVRGMGVCMSMGGFKTFSPGYLTRNIVCNSFGMKKNFLDRSGFGNAIHKNIHQPISMKIKKPSLIFDDLNRRIDSRSWTYQPRTLNQRAYVDHLVNTNVSVLVGLGPAGSGKTLFACSAAVSYLKQGLVDRIIITRPLVSVDEEELGFLPGSIENKMDPWTRPIFDIFGEFFSATQIKTMVKNGVIEISPLAYMRGRTFKRAFIIADEMQNSSPKQMLLMLTRIGESSKLVITGDLKQTDREGVNGLADFIHKIRGGGEPPSSMIRFVELENSDIQRSLVVSHILNIYDSGKKPSVSNHSSIENSCSNKCVSYNKTSTSVSISNIQYNNTNINDDAALIPISHYKKFNL